MKTSIHEMNKANDGQEPAFTVFPSSQGYMEPDFPDKEQLNLAVLRRAGVYTSDVTTGKRAQMGVANKTPHFIESLVQSPGGMR